MGPAVGRIQERSTFRALSRPVARGKSGPVRVTFTPVGGDGRARVAYAIGRRNGNAVQRNRLRRRLRACVETVARQPGTALVTGSYLVRADPAAAELAPADLVRRVGEALVRASSPLPATRTTGPQRTGPRSGKGSKQ